MSSGWPGSTIVTPSRSKPWFAMRFMIRSRLPSRIGRANPSSTITWAARSTFSSVPSGNTTRFGSRFAQFMTIRMVWRALPRRRSRETVYSSRSISRWATPVSMAARATAAASHSSTRSSNGLGIRYSGPNCSRSSP